MYEFGLRAVKRYPPSEKFLEDLCSLLDQWETYVNSLGLLMKEEHVGLKCTCTVCTSTCT